jgi:hypothetical protein
MVPALSCLASLFYVTAAGVPRYAQMIQYTLAMVAGAMAILSCSARSRSKMETETSIVACVQFRALDSELGVRLQVRPGRPGRGSSVKENSVHVYPHTRLSPLEKMRKRCGAKSLRPVKLMHDFFNDYETLLRACECQGWCDVPCIVSTVN